MKTYDEEYFRGLAEDLMFELTTEEATAIKNEFIILQKQLDLLDEIDTEGVEEMIYPFEQPTTFMREDVVEDVLTVDEALSNAKRRRKEYIVLPRVVK
jgi:aspartyl/glutamyl-tRNA(Asn/Gln) amidotransferase, C subunit